MFKKIFPFFTALFFCNCSTHTEWQLDAIGSDLPNFSSRRLIYRSQDPLSEANLELVYFQGEIFGYLSSPSKHLSSSNTLSATLCIDTQRFNTELPLHEGKMRARLPEMWTMHAIEALKEGREVTLILDETVQKINPAQFSLFYQKLVEGDHSLFKFVHGS